MSRRFEISIDNAALKDAKKAMDTCMQIATRRAINTGSYECSATLKVVFKLEETMDVDTGETYISPKIDYRSNYCVPLKDSIDGKVIDICRLIQDGGGGYQLINGQISMDELMEDEEEET